VKPVMILDVTSWFPYCLAYASGSLMMAFITKVRELEDYSEARNNEPRLQH